MEKLCIVKIGGNVIDNSQALTAFLKDFAAVDCKKILIHGGGKIATRLGDKLGIVSNYVDGRRITDDATIDLVTMVYGGLVNKQIVAQLQAAGCNAIGLTGADANCIPATRRPVKEIDYGWVGDVNAAAVNQNVLQAFLQNNLVPVFAPLTHNGAGNMLNTNADTIASALAIALSASYNVRLVYCFEKKGILENVHDDNSVIAHINHNSYKKLLAEKKLFAGILPKIENAFAALNAGVNEVLVGDAKDVLLNCGVQTSGTLFTQ